MSQVATLRLVAMQLSICAFHLVALAGVAIDGEGTATIEPKSVVVGSMVTITITYRAGRNGLPEGATGRFARAHASNWARPQFENPSAPNYASVSGPVGVTLTPSVTRPVVAWAVEVKIGGRPLRHGEAITLTLGDRSNGSPGIRAQTFTQRKLEFMVLTDADGDGKFRKIFNSPRIDVTASDPVNLFVVAPSIVQVGERFAVGVTVEDKFKNPVETYRGVIKLRGNRNVRVPPAHKWTSIDAGAFKFQGVWIAKPGIYTIEAHSDDGLAGESNPIVVTDDRPKYRLLWGDLHGHTIISDGSGTPVEYYTFARRYGHLDFAAVSDHGIWTDGKYDRSVLDHDITPREWEMLKEASRKNNAPGEFVTFLGYEWSSSRYGDHNVYYMHDDEPLVIPHTLPELYRALRNRMAIVIPHVGGRKADLSFHDPQLERVIEVCSAHGHFEWFGLDALKRGYRMGFIGSSDNHCGHPGRSIWGRVPGGLVAVYATECTREAIWDALRNRRCYATTSERIYISFYADGRMMGAEYATSDPPHFRAEVVGTDELVAIELIKNGEVIFRIPTQPVAIEHRLSGKPLRIGDEYNVKLRAHAGTVMLWVKPNWNGGDRKTHNFLDGGPFPRFQIVKHKDGVLRCIMLGKTYTDGTTIGHPVSHWRAGEWHHIAVVWKQGRKHRGELSLFVDGRLVMHSRDAQLPHRLPSKLRIGTRFDGKLPADALLDGLVVLRKPLSAKEIRKAFIAGGGSVNAIGSVQRIEFIDRKFTNDAFYYLRVRQANGEMAWSSPIWVRRALR